MAWLILLVVFWKPVYYTVRWCLSSFVYKDSQSAYWFEQMSGWFWQLVNLVKP